MRVCISDGSDEYTGRMCRSGDGRTEAFHALEQDLARRVDLFLAGQEQKDVALPAP